MQANGRNVHVIRRVELGSDCVTDLGHIVFHCLVKDKRGKNRDVHRNSCKIRGRWRRGRRYYARQTDGLDVANAKFRDSERGTGVVHHREKLEAAINRWVHVAAIWVRIADTSAALVDEVHYFAIQFDFNSMIFSVGNGARLAVLDGETGEA
jgi:hypothetical protein